jgi:hypothetical protein
MTTSLQPQLTTVPDSPDARPCGVCAHGLADHDRVGLRYCEATQTGALSRNCICKSATG